ncbi:hypothetical protein RSSM_00063 [Rhodopirellula sallentina SM41]|uniref:Uncharacterized protein n=1 Tax=Rhodopirellula sallentina SM41 TaxID=1263870 RepID=M5UKZ7_9BACT|nr:hypothetical protein RSSM_00063 [Rhodopirellula sallentina SM41]
MPLTPTANIFDPIANCLAVPRVWRAQSLVGPELPLETVSRLGDLWFLRSVH